MNSTESTLSVKEGKLAASGDSLGRTRFLTSDLLEIILAAFQARATPRIAGESANIRREIFIISDNGGEDRLAPAKA